MIARRFALLLALAPLALFAWGTPAPAADADGAVQHMQHLADGALAVLQRSDMTLEERETALRPILREGFDLQFIGRFTLGRFWKTATPEEQAEYLELFGEYVLKTYAKRLGGYSGEVFAVTGSRAAGEQDIMVATLIKSPDGPELSADWRVRVIDGRHRIIDVMVEGVSMSVTQRDEFASVVANKGVGGLIEILRARTGLVAASAS